MNRSAKKTVSEPSNNLVNDFIDNKTKPAEPKAKKIKIDLSSRKSSDDPDDSMKFFKNLKPRSTKKVPETSTLSSNLATSFLNKSATTTHTTTSKKLSKASMSKATKRKPKSQTDIRKILGKQEQLFNHIVTENCLQEGIDPEEMQLALAISESLKDQTKHEESETPSTSSASSSKFENPFTSMGKVQPISAVLERFGFKCKKTYSEYEIDLITNSKVSKRSKFQKFPTQLTRTSNEKRNEMIKFRIDKVLEQNHFQGSADYGDDSHVYQVFSFYLQDLQENMQTVFMISREDRPTDKVLLSYYVTELFEPSFVKADHLLKNWSLISGRDPTPERILQSEELSVLHEHRKKDDRDEEVIGVMAEPEPEMEDAEDEPENNSKMSCLDIFADLEDFEIESNIKESSGSLAGHLDSLQEKFSQSLLEPEPEDMKKSSASDTTIENVDCLINEPVMEVEQVDLTQQDSSESNFTIPYDDSYYSLQQHFKKLNEAKGNSPVAQRDEIIIKDKLSPIQVDLVSSDDEINVTLQPNEPVENIEEPNEDEGLMLSQNSQDDDDELIEISDEEINYSIRKFHNNNESPDSSSQSPVKKEETVDLTQEALEPESSGTQLEVENYAEQSLIDVMDEQYAFNINDTISNLLETSMSAINITKSAKDRSTKFMVSDGLSESIRDIMTRYGVTSEENENPRSFRKMQSDSQLVNESVRKRRTVRFSIDEAVDLTQHIEFDESVKENSFELNNFNNSIHQSLENIVSYSPIASRKIVQRKEKPNPRAKKSLGVQLDDDYIVDTESLIPEPDYKNMTPVELKQALFKYGIRSLPVKKAVTLLEFIYDQLHPTIRVAADEEIDVNDSRRDMNFTDIVTNINVQQDDDFVFQLGLVDDEEEFILPKVRKSKNPTCAIPLHISFYNMVRSNGKIQKFILEFRPIELDQVHKHFRKFGLSYQMNDIIAFLDKRCITFKTKEQSLSKTHEKKKQKRAQKSQKSKSQKM